MAHDDNVLRGSSYSGTTGGDGEGNGGGGLNNTSIRSKKVKQKKVPQRGLGVAQLERIREEQQRKEALAAANTLANNVIGVLGDSVQTTKIRPPVSPSPNPRPVPLVQNVEILHRGSSQIPKQVIGLDSMSSPRHGNWPKSWNSESSISLLNSQMEPPSNQSFRGNNYPTASAEEDKMTVGMKRPYPFSLEGPPAPSFRCNIPNYAASRSTDDLVTCSNRYKPQSETRNKHSSRESYSNTMTLLDPGRDSTEVIRDDERLKGDFLTLAPPLSATSPPSNSKHEHLLYSRRWQEKPGGQMLRLGPSASAERPFSFFPDKYERDQNTTGVGNVNDGNSEIIDLNLKL